MSEKWTDRKYYYDNYKDEMVSLGGGGRNREEKYLKCKINNFDIVCLNISKTISE